jgi:xanthine dehydrogenase accessory factor
VNRDTYVAIVGRGHKVDADALAAVIGGPAGYIGMMGSRRKVALIRRDFLQAGLATENQFDRVHAPIGLDIGAETVPEIAASIVAEMIAVRRGKRREPKAREP